MAQEDEVVSLKNSDSYKHLQKTSNDFALAAELVVGLQQLIESDRKAPELPHPNDFIEPSDGDRSVLKDMQVEDIAEKPDYFTGTTESEQDYDLWSSNKSEEFFLNDLDGMFQQESNLLDKSASQTQEDTDFTNGFFSVDSQNTVAQQQNGFEESNFAEVKNELENENPAAGNTDFPLTKHDLIEIAKRSVSSSDGVKRKTFIRLCIEQLNLVDDDVRFARFKDKIENGADAKQFLVLPHTDISYTDECDCRRKIRKIRREKFGASWTGTWLNLSHENIDLLLEKTIVTLPTNVGGFKKIIFGEGKKSPNRTSFIKANWECRDILNKCSISRKPNTKEDVTRGCIGFKIEGNYNIKNSSGKNLRKFALLFGYDLSSHSQCGEGPRNEDFESLEKKLKAVKECVKLLVLNKPELRNDIVRTLKEFYNDTVSLTSRGDRLNESRSNSLNESPYQSDVGMLMDIKDFEDMYNLQPISSKMEEDLTDFRFRGEKNDNNDEDGDLIEDIANLKLNNESLIDPRYSKCSENDFENNKNSLKHTDTNEHHSQNKNVLLKEKKNQHMSPDASIFHKYSQMSSRQFERSKRISQNRHTASQRKLVSQENRSDTQQRQVQNIDDLLCAISPKMVQQFQDTIKMVNLEGFRAFITRFPHITFVTNLYFDQNQQNLVVEVAGSTHNDAGILLDEMLNAVPSHDVDLFQDGKNALLTAVWNEHDEIVETLLQHNARTDLSCFGCRTPLMIAIIRRNYIISRMILSRSAEKFDNVSVLIRQKDEDGRNSLHHAIECGDLRIFELILINTKTSDDEKESVAFVDTPYGVLSPMELVYTKVVDCYSSFGKIHSACWEEFIFDLVKKKAKITEPIMKLAFDNSQHMPNAFTTLSNLHKVSAGNFENDATDDNYSETSGTKISETSLGKKKWGWITKKLSFKNTRQN